MHRIRVHLLTVDGWSFDDAYRYRLRVDQLRQPLLQAIVGSGWRFLPVVTFV